MRIRTAVLSLLLVAGSLLLPVPPGEVGAVPIDFSGDIITTVSWSLATSPVHVVGNISVRVGGTLNIKEGTEVLFDEGTWIAVEGGALVIEGTSTAPVRFLPNTSAPYSGYYQWIHVRSQLDKPSSLSARWAEFSRGAKGFYLEGVQGAVIQDCRFDGVGEAGMYLSGCSGVMVQNCVFNGSGGWGVRAELSDNVSILAGTFSGCAASSVSFSDCVYSSVSSVQVTADVSESGLELQGCSNIHIDRLTVADAPRGLELVNSGQNTVYGCAFQRDGIGLVLNSSTENVFRGNNFTDCPLPLSFSGGPELASNTFETSNTVGGLPVRFLNSGDLDGVAAGAVVLAGCTGSTVSNITFPNTGGAIFVLYGSDCVLRDLVLDRSPSGTVVIGSPGLRLHNVTLTNSPKTGLSVLESDGTEVRNCTITGCDTGAAFGGRMDITLHGSNLRGNSRDLSTASEVRTTAIDCSVGSIETGEESQVEEDYTLSVKVTDRASAPVSGAQMRVLSGGEPRYATPRFGGTDPVSDAAGAFAPLVLPGAIHRYGARTDINTTAEVWDGVNAFEWNPRTFQLRAPTGAAFIATEVGFLSGVVLDPVGDPIGGVDLLLDGGMSATTGTDGSYLFPPLAPGNYSMDVSLPGWEPLHLPVVPVTAGVTKHVNLTMQAAAGSTGELRGTVLDDRGGPVAGAFVQVAGGPGALSDTAGLFSVSGAPGGFVNFSASKAGHLGAAGQAFVPPGGRSRWTNITLVASAANATGAISVQVVDAFSGPLQGARVVLDGNTEAPQLTPANGTCLFSGVPAGFHLVAASLAGYAPASANVTVIAGSVAGLTLVLNLEPSGNGSVAGTVRGLTGAAIAGASVVLEELNLSATTDAAGNYSIGPVPAGLHNITASAEGFAPETVIGVVVLGNSITFQDFVLRPERVFTNRTLGVRVLGDFTGAGRLDIRRAPALPEPPPGGFDRFFEVTATGFTCMTGLRIEVRGQLFRDSLSGRDLGRYDVRLYTRPSGMWDPGERWEAIAESGYDAEGGLFWANVSHFSVFGIGFTAKGTGPTGTTIVALPPWLSPLAVVAIVLLVGVPIGIIVIRVRQPPSGGGGRQGPVLPPRQSGTNL
ncbi:MAG: hypothetical protein FJ149_00305 [Euryarchaeota archaeon]|nr:hypothetical protein [Euryarchaeota archaeon]